MSFLYFLENINKTHDQGKLFDIAMKQMQETNYSKVLLIDDSQKARWMFETKGWKTYPYTNFEDFYERAKTHLEIIL